MMCGRSRADLISAVRKIWDEEWGVGALPADEEVESVPDGAEGDFLASSDDEDDNDGYYSEGYQSAPKSEDSSEADDDGMFPCPLCPKKLDTKSGRSKHISLVHPRERKRAHILLRREVGGGERGEGEEQEEQEEGEELEELEELEEGEELEELEVPCSICLTVMDNLPLLNCMGQEDGKPMCLVACHAACLHQSASLPYRFDLVKLDARLADGQSLRHT